MFYSSLRVPATRAEVTLRIGETVLQRRLHLYTASWVKRTYVPRHPLPPVSVRPHFGQCVSTFFWMKSTIQRQLQWVFILCFRVSPCVLWRLNLRFPLILTIRCLGFECIGSAADLRWLGPAGEFDGNSPNLTSFLPTFERGGSTVAPHRTDRRKT